MKRFVSVVLVLCTVISLCVLPAMAAEKATVSISSGTVKAGEEITLTVSIEDNPGLATCLLFFYYDTSVFSVDAKYGIKTAGDFALTGKRIVNSIADAQANGRYENIGAKEGMLALWYNNSGMNTVDDGAMLTITLKVKPDSMNGGYAIGLGYSELDTTNEKAERVPLVLSGGTITVTGGTEEQPEEETPETEGEDPDPEAPEVSEDGIPQFRDVENHWAQSYIEDAAALGLIEGYNGLYRPDDTMTRAECVTILWRANGEPAPAQTASFVDLDPMQKWYHEAVAWAEETGVMNGVGNGKFDPNGKITREQLATILFREAGGQSGMELMFSGLYNEGFTDSGKISDWAKSGLYWSVYNEIYCGTDRLEVGTALNPQIPANRAQIAVMMVRYLALMEK